MRSFLKGLRIFCFCSRTAICKVNLPFYLFPTGKVCTFDT